MKRKEQAFQVKWQKPKKQKGKKVAAVCSVEANRDTLVYFRFDGWLYTPRLSFLRNSEE